MLTMIRFLVSNTERSPTPMKELRQAEVSFHDIVAIYEIEQKLDRAGITTKPEGYDVNAVFRPGVIIRVGCSRKLDKLREEHQAIKQRIKRKVNTVQTAMKRLQKEVEFGE